MDTSNTIPSTITAEWQPHVAAAGPPFAFRLGAVGFGAGAGCGAGIGFGRPVSLSAIPIAAQAVQGISAGLGASLGGAGAAVAGAASAARRGVQRLGVRHLDAGVGCGIGVGYGFFAAGLLLKPSAVDGLQQGARALAGEAVWVGGCAAFGYRFVAVALCTVKQSSPPPCFIQIGTAASFVQNSLGSIGIRLPTASTSASSAAGEAPGSSMAAAPAGPPALEAAGPHHLLQQGLIPLLGPGPASPQHQQSYPPSSGEDKEVARTLLRHQRQLEELRRQNRSLRAALCKLDPKAAVCDTKKRVVVVGGGGWDDTSDG